MPPGFAEYMRAYRFLLFFGIACVEENKYPPLTRCWKELEKLFMSDPAFEDGVFVQSWATAAGSIMRPTAIRVPSDWKPATRLMTNKKRKSR